MRYAGYHNFLGRPVVGYQDPVCILTTDAAVALSRVQHYLVSLSPVAYSIKVYDCYRPRRAVMDFVNWALDLNDTKTKAEFYPTLGKDVLFDQGYIGYNSSHCRGSTSDLTIVPLPPANQPNYIPGQALTACFEPVGQRWKDNSEDMGTGFDCFSPLSHTNTSDPTIGPEQHKRRTLLVQAMSQYGNFSNYEYEWWHYTLRNEPFPNQAFDFIVANDLKPVEPPATSTALYIGLTIGIVLLLLVAVVAVRRSRAQHAVAAKEDQYRSLDAQP
jgi:D-alanyl-D-alanine dipeptidase